MFTNPCPVAFSCTGPDRWPCWRPVALFTQAERAHPAGSGRQIRMGVVGGGFGAAFWWHKHPQCVVTGVMDLRPDRRDILRQRYHCDRVYDTFETMVKDADDIDRVAGLGGGSAVSFRQGCMNSRPRPGNLGAPYWVIRRPHDVAVTSRS